MKYVFKLAGILILFGFLFFFSTKLLLTQQKSGIKTTPPTKTQNTTLQETYISTVIISALYAKGNLVYGGKESPAGEFGYHVSEEEGFVGGLASTFAVAPNGDIYINDPLNNRIQRFSPEGSFISTIPTKSGESNPVDICIDQNNNIYLLRYGWKPELLGDRKGTIGAVLKCDQLGNILKTYPVFTGVASTGNFVYCDKSGNIFVSSGYPFQVGTSSGIFPLAQQKYSALNGFLGMNSVLLDSNCFFQAAILPRGIFRALYLVNFSGDTIKTYHPYPPQNGGFFGCDEELNIYIGSYSGMRKYNTKGVLIGGGKCSCEKPYIEVEGHARSRTLDEKGNLYILCENEGEGIKVVKCYKEQ